MYPILNSEEKIRRANRINAARTIEDSARGGKTQGAANKESGHWDEIKAIGQSEGGKVQGTANITNGVLGFARHVRWHVQGSHNARGTWVDPKPKQSCSYCIEAGLIIYV